MSELGIIGIILELFLAVAAIILLPDMLAIIAVVICVGFAFSIAVMELK